MLLDKNGCNLSESCVPWYFKLISERKKLNLSRKLQINILIVFRRVLAMQNDILHYFLFLNNFIWDPETILPANICAENSKGSV